MGSAEIRLRTRFPRFMDALTPRPRRADVLSVELDRIASDPATRALFLAALDTAIAAHIAEAAESAAFTEAATGTLHAVVRPPTGERAR
ncbi:hypothetical protein AB0C40_19185 [Streptomyces brevispora]|uniref:hypothetical protein n=1 Tax=Streptomyces brevispora TaxID=887462 RepID=UPI0033F50E56